MANVHTSLKELGFKEDRIRYEFFGLRQELEAVLTEFDTDAS
jgi:hypothetical protein